MLRYIGIVERRDRVELVASIIDSLFKQSSLWREVFVARGFRLFVANHMQSAHQVSLLHGNIGVILGTIFDRNPDIGDETAAVSSSALSPLACQIIQASRGQQLVDAYWGQYVAFLLDHSKDSLNIIRSPDGPLPCHHLRCDGVGLTFSHIADIAALGILRARLNESFVVEQVVGWSNPTIESIDGVTTVHRGECLDISLRDQCSPPTLRCYWHPMRFARATEHIEDPKLAARAIRSTLRSCTHTLLTRHTSILHRLSGGLDSSIILGCIKAAPTSPHVTCYTYYTPNNPSDERKWARLAIQGTGYEHVERSIKPSDFDLSTLPSLPLSLEPRSIVEFIYRESKELPLAASHGADAIYCGDGGDSGFGKHSIAFCLIQYLQQHGLGEQTLRIARDVALFTEQTAWEILLKSLRCWLLGSRTLDQRHDFVTCTRLVDPELLASCLKTRRYEHRWFSDMTNIPWATIHQLGALTNGVEFSDDVVSHPGMPDIVSPLYAQPMVELLLRIPVYVHFEAGQERGLARRAFEGDVPAKILQRLWKDRVPGFHESLLARHRQALREMLLDGILIRKHLLDRRAVEAALSESASKNDVLPTEILKHLDVEVWLRNWEARGSS